MDHELLAKIGFPVEKEITEKLRGLVAETWSAQAMISPADLSDPFKRAAFLQIRDNMNAIVGITGTPAGMKEWPTERIYKRAWELADGKSPE